MKIGQQVQTLNWSNTHTHAHREHGNLTGLLFSLQRESMLKANANRMVKHKPNSRSSPAYAALILHKI
jgi:hypothetical protein